MTHGEYHRAEHIGWLRAAVLGANDGLISTSSLVLGVGATGASQGAILISGLAGLVAGALSMAAGEFVSVSSQADTEGADLAREKAELETDPEGERRELAAIYVARGLDEALASQVAEQLMAHDALGAHLRDELGIIETTRARPLQAALASAAAFACGGAPPVIIALALSPQIVTPAVLASSFVLLFALGALAAQQGGAPLFKGAARVAFWGALAMGCTYAIGSLFDIKV